MLGNVLLLCCRRHICFNLNLSKNSLTLSECQTVWIQIGTDDRASVLIRFQTVCIGYMYQQTVKVAASKEIVKGLWIDPSDLLNLIWTVM